jgi:hypothetical protein
VSELSFLFWLAIGTEFSYLHVVETTIKCFASHFEKKEKKVVKCMPYDF